MIVETIIGLVVLLGAGYVIYNMLNKKELPSTVAAMKSESVAPAASAPKTASAKKPASKPASKPAAKPKAAKPTVAKEKKPTKAKS